MADEKPKDQQNEQNSQEHDSEARKRPNPRKKRLVRFVLLALVLVGVIAAVPIYAYFSSRESTDDAQVDGHLIPISPRVNGTVLSVLVNDNQQVKAGQELVLLDPADYKANAAQAEAQVATALASATESSVNVPLTNITTASQVSTSGAEVEQAGAGVRSAERAADAARARLEVANAQLLQARANYEKSQHDLARFKDLVQKDEISKQDYDAAVAAADAGTAQVTSAKADILAAKHQLDQSLAEVDQAKAKLLTAEVQRRQSMQVKPRQAQVSQARYQQAQAQEKQAQAALELARLNLSYTRIVAPVDGMISRKTAEPGMQVAPGQQLMSLIPLDDVWVTANFKETQLRAMHVGQKVEIKTDTFGGGHKYSGHIDSIAAASGAKFSLLPPENATGNYVKVVQRIPVKILLEPGENRDHKLLPGMSVEPTVLLDTASGQSAWH